MIDLSTVDIAYLLLTGMLLGGMFFGGLWWTVRRCVGAKHPASLMLASLLIRMSALLTGLYYVGQGRWQRILVILIGILATRVLFTRFNRHTMADERHHAA